MTFSGDVEVRADFMNNAVAGDLENFTDSNSDTYTGGFTLINGDIDRSVNPSLDFTIFADLEGSIENDRTAEVYEAEFGDAELLGDFYDDGNATIPSTVRGELDGGLQKVGGNFIQFENGSSFNATR